MARGEIHQYARLAFTTTARRPDGSLLFRDSLRVEPAVQPPSVLGLLGDARAVGSYFLLGPEVAPRARGAARRSAAAAAGPGGLLAAATPAGLFVRVLATTADDLGAVQREILALARQRLFGRAAGHAYKP